MSFEKTMAAFAATAEMLGKNYTDHQLILFSESIRKYDQEQFLDALRRVREECKFFSLAEVIERIDDGRPDAEEAWSLVRFDEESTFVMNDDIGAALAVASVAYESGDMVGAKMAFKEKYKAVVASARAKAEPVKWFISFGSDKSKQAEPIVAALEAGRIEKKMAIMHLPKYDDGVVAGMIENKLSQGSSALLEALPPETHQ